MVSGLSGVVLIESTHQRRTRMNRIMAFFQAFFQNLFFGKSTVTAATDVVHDYTPIDPLLLPRFRDALEFPQAPPATKKPKHRKNWFVPGPGHRLSPN